MIIRVYFLQINHIIKKNICILLTKSDSYDDFIIGIGLKLKKTDSCKVCLENGL